MPIEELDSLLNSFAEADRASVREIIARNPGAQAQLETRETIHRAFTAGDMDSLAAIVVPPAVVTPPVVVPPSADLASLDARLNDFRSSLFKAPEFQSAVDARAKELAKAAVDEARASIVGTGMKLSAEISDIRESHFQEFGKRLDNAAFEKYFIDNGSNFDGSLTKAHDAFVGEERVQKRIADGIAEDRKVRATGQVPGTALPESDSVAGHMLKHNIERTGGKVESGPDANAAAIAFEQMRRGWAN